MSLTASTSRYRQIVYHAALQSLVSASVKPRLIVTAVCQVLSVIAQQLLVLREARLEGSKDVVFEGRTIPLKEHHVVVTMNPGYLGRTELPDNLKVRFATLFQ